MLDDIPKYTIIEDRLEEIKDLNLNKVIELEKNYLKSLIV
jgi:hypothetical protein